MSSIDVSVVLGRGLLLILLVTDSKTSVSEWRERPGTGERDNPDAVVRFFDTGHFALETRAAEIASAMRDFLRC